MSRTGSARDEILASIRAHLAASAPHDTVSHRPSAVTRKPLPLAPETIAPVLDTLVEDVDPAHRFMQQATSVGASCEIARDESEAAASVARVLAALGARRVASSGAPLVQRVLAAARPGMRIDTIDTLSREDLFACDAGITTAQLGIAETGTLVLESARETHRLLSLVPPAHVALLDAHDICDSLADVITRLGANVGVPDVGSHAVTFITGPSRTSDIELTLTIGVHGPRLLHVIILESQS
jgi:L-lactate dehydrogenase complex protein LldG